LREFATKNNIKIPSKSKKNNIITLLKNIVSHEEFVDRSQEVEEPEEELVAGFDDDEDFALLRKEKMELKFWQKPPFSSLLDPELAKESEIAFYDLASLVDEFFGKMLHEDLINYKISGIALKTSASLHHYKISSIIREEEQIQKKEELEKFRQRHSRSIPKALPQPIQPKMQIATKDELFDAMRSAIIETMQNKEKLKRRRIRREELKQQKIQMKSKAQLPKELLRHISGKEQTVQELHDSWYNRIKGTINLNNKETSFFDLTSIIKGEEESRVGRKFALVRMFLALMFLSTGNKLNLVQDEDFKDISVDIR
jgi:chromatin segregation and condensation protein Rec8/ScpA/Scc1 (kleisin family)